MSNELQLTNIRFLMEGDYKWKSFFSTCSGKFKLSVLAGALFYSSPRTVLAFPEEYTEVELAIFFVKEDGTTEWASYNQLKECGAFDILETQGEYTEYPFTWSEDEIFTEEDLQAHKAKPQISVFGWVPVDKVMELYQKI